MLNDLDQSDTGVMRKVRLDTPALDPRGRDWLLASGLSRLAGKAGTILKSPALITPPRLLPLRPAPDRSSHWLWLWLWGSFVVFFISPVLASTIYFGFLASNQFVSEMRFAVRGTTELLPGSDAMGFAGLGRLISLNSSQDVYVIADYIESREMIDDLSGEIDLQSIYSKPGIDWWARFAPSTAAEDLIRYWRGMVETSVELVSGIVTVTVKTFSPEDSVRLASSIRARCEIVAEQLLDKMRGNAIEQAKAEVSAAKARLASKRAQLETFRTARMQVDPMAVARSLGDTVTALRRDLIGVEVRLHTAKASLASDAPQIKMLAENQQILAGQIAALETKITSANETSPASSAILHEYDRLDAERSLAEQVLVLAERQLDNAQTDANRHHIYLVSIEEPTVPQAALAPQRLQMILIVSLIALGTFLLVTMIAANVRDHAL